MPSRLRTSSGIVICPCTGDLAPRHRHSLPQFLTVRISIAVRTQPVRRICAAAKGPSNPAQREPECSRREPARSALSRSPRSPNLPEVRDNPVFARTRSGNQILHLLTGNAQSFQVCLARFRPGRDIDADCCPMARNRNRCFRFQIVSQILTKLPDSDFGGVHGVVYTMITQ